MTGLRHSARAELLRRALLTVPVIAVGPLALLALCTTASVLAQAAGRPGAIDRARSTGSSSRSAWDRRDRCRT